MRRRSLRKAFENETKPDRWLVSYADFITLLFAFFVVMYAVSTISEGKYRLFAAHLDASFSTVAKALLPIQFGPTPATFIPLEPLNDKPTEGPFSQTSNEYIDEEYIEVASELKTSLKGLIDEEKILVKETDNWLEIEIKAKVLFRVASASLLPEANPILKSLADLLKQYKNPVQVEGFTDNVPISNELFPSNWELSAARSASVTRKLIDYGVDPIRLAAVGYGKNFPVRDNATPKGRDANRRVVLLIAKQPRRQRLIELQQRGNRGEPVNIPVSTNATPGQIAGQVPSSNYIATPAQKAALKPKRTNEGGFRFSAVDGRGEVKQEAQ